MRRSNWKYLVLALTFIFLFRFGFKMMENSNGQLDVSIQFRHKNISGLDFDKLQTMIKELKEQNLRVYITQDRKSHNDKIHMVYTPMNFPKIIDVSFGPRRPYETTKKYAFVYFMFNEQLSKNTRAFLSLCAQAGRSNRYVVKPYVKGARFSQSQDSWLDFDTYYNVDHMEELLTVSNYAGLVEKDEYFEQCPINDSGHVSIYFVDDSQTSKNAFMSTFRLKRDYVNKITADASRNGWTECNFIDKAMGRVPGKQYCVHSTVIKDWTKLEEEIVKEHKCLNIFQWRGIDGVEYRLKFSEDDLKFSSVDLTFALRPGMYVENEVEDFTEEFLSDNYIAIYLRSEIVFRHKNMDYLRKCVDLVLEVLQYLVHFFICTSVVTIDLLLIIIDC